MRRSAWCVAIALVGAACGGDEQVRTAQQSGTEVTSDADAIAGCNQRRSSYLGFELVGAFTSDARTVRAWKPVPGPLPEGWELTYYPREFQDLADDAPLFVCYIEGEFATPGPPGHTVPERAVILVGPDGLGVPIVYHTRDGLPLERPTVEYPPESTPPEPGP